MKNRVLQLAAALALAGLAATANAATTTGNFTVNITLNSACALSTVADVNFSYTSFQAGPATATGGGFNIQCTNMLPYTMAISGAAVTDDAVNLAYTLTLSAPGGTGNGGVQTYTVNGTMAGGQGGNCAAATCTNGAATNKTKTLTITY